MIGLGTFWRSLPTEGRWLLSTIAVHTLGRGLTLPFTVIYLHEVRGFDLDLSGTLMALVAVAALVVTGPGGSAVDRYGARAMLLSGSTAMVLGNVLLAFATTPAVAAAGLALIGLNFGVSWSASNALIAAIVSGPLRQQYFGLNFALVNLGIGVGGILGGLFVDVSEPTTFTAIFLLDGASALIPVALLLGPLRHIRSHGEPDTALPTEGYGEILRRPSVRWLTGLVFVAVFLGYGQFEAGLPSFARQVSEVSTRTIGIGFAVNTAVIVLLQFAVLTRTSGRRRTRMIVATALVWISAWSLLGGTGLVPGGALAATGLFAFMAVFALGETLMQPATSALTNDLATERTRGRYNALVSAAFQLGAISGPVVAGFLLDRDLWPAYIGVLVLAALAICGMALALERRIAPAENGVLEPVPAQEGSAVS